MNIFLKYSTVSKTTKSKTVIRIFYETAKHKRFRFCQPKGSFSFFFVRTFACLFIVLTPALDECLDFGHPPAVIVVSRACVCIFVDLR